MRSNVLIASCMAMFAMVCTAAPVTSVAPAVVVDAVPVPSLALEKRTLPFPFDATVDLLVKANADIVAKAFAEVCTDLDISKSIDTNLKVKVSGLVNVDIGLGAKVASKLHASIKAAVKAEVDLEVKTQFTANLKANIGKTILNICPKKDSKCIHKNASLIVSAAIDLTLKATAKIDASIRANLAAKIKACIDVQLKNLNINLLLVKIQVTGDAKISASLYAKFKLAVKVVAKVCADVKASLIAQIKAL
ncbi:hypothetical protein EC968_007430 [Mortierella alpina]|nr:hypothetical protein EC968_007430 [Mortierella alpina]